MENARFWIEQLALQKHPEGGWFKEMYRSALVLDKAGLSPDFDTSRNCSTAIFYLLEDEDFSAFHRIKSDELWHFYTGTSAIEIVLLGDGEIEKKTLGGNILEGEMFQVLVPKNRWFSARLKEGSGYALAGCTVAPGFDFMDLEFATEETLKDFPDLNPDKFIKRQ